MNPQSLSTMRNNETSYEEETCRTCVNHLNTLVCPITVQDKADIHGCKWWQSKKDEELRKDMYADTEMSKEKGCTTCPYAGHIDLKECPNAYTEKSKECGNYNHEQLCTQTQTLYSNSAE